MYTSQHATEESIVTAEELTEWLRSAGLLTEAASVRGFEAQPVGDGVGFTGRLERLALEFDGDASGAPRSLILKRATDAEDIRETMTGNGLYEKEVRFYNELAADSDIPTPACYFAASEDSGDFRLVLEDIGEATSLDQVAGATREQARAIVEALARFHAGWWGSKRLAALEWVGLSEDLLADTRVRYRQGLPSFRAALAKSHLDLAEYADKIDGLLDSIDPSLQTKHDTLVHGDFRLDNIFVRPGQPDAFIFADWQLVSRGLGATDLARFMAESLETGVRREIEEDLLAVYHTTLVEAGVRGYSRRRLRQDYRAGMLIQLVLLVVATDTLEWDQGGGRGQLLAETLASRLEKTMVDEKMGRLLWIAPWVIRFQNAGKRLRNALARFGRARKA